MSDDSLRLVDSKSLIRLPIVEEYRIRERIETEYLRCGGKLQKTISRLSQFNPDLVALVCEECKGRYHTDEKSAIAKFVYDQFRFEIDVAKTHVLDALESLESDQKPVVSLCCNYPVVFHADSYADFYTCIKCNIRCDVKGIPVLEIYELRRKLLADFVSYSKEIIASAKELNFKNYVGPANVTNVKQNVLVLGEKQDQVISEEYAKLSPMDREKLIERLRMEIVNIDEQLSRRVIATVDGAGVQGASETQGEGTDTCQQTPQ